MPVRLDHLKEDSPANQIPRLLEPIFDQADIRRKREEEAEEAQWRLQLAKDNLIRATNSRKTCSQCPFCNLLFLTRKEAMLHFQTSHTQDNTSHIQYPRIHLHRDGLCALCNFNKPFNLNLSCSLQLCESCLLDLMHCNEHEGSDHVTHFHFRIHCPLCRQPHFIDPHVATFLYDLSDYMIPISEGCPLS